MHVDVMAVVGAGFAGSGIAASSARAGKHVIVYEPEAAPLERSRKALDASLRKAQARGKVGDANEVLSRIVHTTTFKDLRTCDAVVEAIV